MKETLNFEELASIGRLFTINGHEEDVSINFQGELVVDEREVYGVYLPTSRFSLLFAISNW